MARGRASTCFASDEQQRQVSLSFAPKPIMAGAVLRGDEDLLTGRWGGLVVLAGILCGCGNGDGVPAPNAV